MIQFRQDSVDLVLTLLLSNLFREMIAARVLSKLVKTSSPVVRKRSLCLNSSGMERAKFFMMAQLAYVENLLPRA